MANKQINAYTAAATIDPVNDQFLIDPGGTGAYLKINRNTTLGITGSPVGTTDTQTVTNKTIGNTNSVTVKDGSFTLNNSTDTTKVGIFSLANNTTGTTRTYTLPNASVTLSSLTGTEILTNKTLTSPTITGGTISNATITVDSIAGFSTSTIVTVANLQISNGVLNSSNAVTAVSIASGAIQPQALIAGTGTGWSWTAWTPTWSGITVGNGTVEAKYIQVGKTVICRVRLTFGSTTTVTGDTSITLPVTAVSSYSTLTQHAVGTLLCVGSFDSLAAVLITDNTHAFFEAQGAGGAYLTTNAFSSSVPFVWVTSNWIAGTFNYEAA